MDKDNTVGTYEPDLTKQTTQPRRGAVQNIGLPSHRDADGWEDSFEKECTQQREARLKGNYLKAVQQGHCRTDH